MSQFSEHDPTSQRLRLIAGIAYLNEHGLPRRGWRRTVIRIGLVLLLVPVLVQLIALVYGGLTGH